MQPNRGFQLLEKSNYHLITIHINGELCRFINFEVSVCGQVND